MRMLRNESSRPRITFPIHRIELDLLNENQAIQSFRQYLLNMLYREVPSLTSFWVGGGMFESQSRVIQQGSILGGTMYGPHINTDELVMLATFNTKFISKTTISYHLTHNRC